MRTTSTSESLFHASERRIPGGVNSPVRAFGAVGGTPVFFERGAGAYLWDVDGNRYLDFVGSWGPAILGHAAPKVVEAVKAAAEKGLSFGAPTEGELRISELICGHVPSIEQMRLVSSGTEATMSAIRLARGYTGREAIIKFEGCYHGHADMLLVKAGSGALTHGNPSSAGVPSVVAAQTLVLPYNDAIALQTAIEKSPEQFAAVIIEPVAGNMNMVVPSREFMAAVRELCARHGIVLIFDEVMTGFRVGLGGAQAYFGIRPDLTTLGKVVGGGMPLAAFGGRQDIMAALAPVGPVYQAGTLSGNPVAVAAGIATLEAISRPGFFEELSERTAALAAGLRVVASEFDIEVRATSLGGMFGFYFLDRLPRGFADVMKADREKFNRFFHLMLEQGIYLAPSSYEAGFVSAAHSDADIQFALEAARSAFRELSKS